MAGYLLLLSLAVAGLANAGLWLVIPGGLALHLTVADRYWPLWKRARAINKQRFVETAWAVSVLQALIAAGCAYALGLGMAWLSAN